MKDLISDLQAEQLASTEIVTKITSDMKVLENGKIHFAKITSRLDSNDRTNENKFIHINVGGDNVTLSATSIEQHSSVNYLYALLSSKYCHLIPKDRNGKVFLDMDVRWVEPQLNWLRDMAMWNGDETSVPKMSTVQALLKEGHAIISNYFQASHTGQSYETQEHCWLSSQSSILRDYPTADEAMQTMLHPADMGCMGIANLLYKSSRDGLTAASFHKHCDGRKNTLCIVRDTDNNVFGGFTGDVAWKTATGSTYDSINAPNSFLFSLVRNGKFNSVKFNGTQRSSLLCSVASTDLFLFAFCGRGSICDLVIGESNGSCKGLGRGYENPTKYSITNDYKFTPSEIEVFEMLFNESHNSSVSCHVESVATSQKLSNCVSTLYTSHPIYAPLLQCRADTTSRIMSVLDDIKRETELLEARASALLNELKFVARQLGITLPDIVECKREDETCFQNLSELQDVVNEIEAIIKLLFVDRADTSGDDVSDASSIVYINAGGRKIATAKGTLLQAPSGSILANMASDVWGHDLDSKGNIFQDVNPDLFTAIINHLRLKALLLASEVHPITVYAEQKTALDNLLLFYMIEDVRVKLITDVAVCYSS